MSAEMVGQIDKPIVPADPPNWAPLNPAEKEFRVLRRVSRPKSRNDANRSHVHGGPLFCDAAPVTRVTDRQITCRFERDKMIDFSGSGLPPQGYDIGGVSGGPMLMPTLTDIKESAWRFAGVIVEAAAGVLLTDRRRSRNLPSNPPVE